MFSKIKINGKVLIQSGLHIGGGGETSMIGALDSPVVRDTASRLPIIPGSSLKGKGRYLLAKYKSENIILKDHNQDHEQVTRLFGASSDNDSNVIISRLQFFDCQIADDSKQAFIENDINITEIKYENSIRRDTMIAMPRQIERVTRGTKFNFELIYNVENAAEVVEDFENIQLMLDLLRNDYLGGGGTRGNGRVDFQIDEIKTVIGDYDSSSLSLQ